MGGSIRMEGAWSSSLVSIKHAEELKGFEGPPATATTR
jgi:hypothetical protein